MKAVPNSAEPFTAEGIGEIQAAVDKHFNDFLEAISKNKRISMDQALELSAEGRVFQGEEAIAAGLADGEGTVESAVNELNSRSERRMFAFIGQKFDALMAHLSGSSNQPPAAVESSTEEPESPINETMANENNAAPVDTAAAERIQELQAELLTAQNALQEHENAQVAAELEEAKTENETFVGALADAGKIKAIHTNRLVALMNALHGAENISFVEGTGTKEEAPAEVLSDFLNTLQPIVPLQADESEPVTMEAISGDAGATAKVLAEMVKSGAARSPAEALAMLKKQAAE
jgi:hypothetical protein